ncbi:MAG: hypothetical protein AAGH74_08585 [Pseudomonadota bacterium]
MVLFNQIPVSLVSAIALLISLALALGMARNGLTRSFYLALMCLHVLGSLAVYALTLRAPADAHRYYAESEWLREFALGTQFISFTLGWIREFTNLTFLDAFMLFQIPGLVGILLLHRAATHIAAEEFNTRVLLLGLLLLSPGLHMWTSSIGKDSLAIFAYGLISIAVMRREVNLLYLSLGLLIYFLIRPHIAFELVAAMMLAFLPILGQSTRRTRLLGFGAAALFVIMLPFVFGFVGIDGKGVDDVQTYVESRQNIAFRGGSSFDLVLLNPVERILTTLFRPFFFDAINIFGLAASVENLFLLLIFGYLAWHFQLILILMKNSAMLRFHVFFMLIFLAIFTQTVGNLGLALRQKVMMIPALFILLTMVIAYKNRRRQERREALSTSAQPAQ